MLQMDTSEELAAKLQKALEENNSKCALQLLEYTDNQQELKNKSWDLIPIISQHLTEYNSINNVVLFECCVNLLRIISVKSNFEEALLQFISEVEEADSDVKFLAFLGPLTTLILQISDEKLGSYAWVFNSIQTYLLNCKIPEIDSGIDDRDKAVLRIIALYNEIIPFYENILHLKENQGVKGVLCKFLIQLLGAPLCYLKIDKSDTVKKSDGFVMNEKILNILFKCLSDPIFLLTEFRKSKKTDSFTKPNDLSIANLIYLLYSEKIFFNCIPQVYSFEYIFQSSTYLLSSLLENDDTVLTEKALKLGESLFKPLQNKNVTYLFLSYDEQCEFCKQLCYVIGYNSVESIRKDALKVFNYYLTMYETRGRYQLILNLVKILTHNNLKGYLITFYKNLMVNDKLNDSNYPSLYFKGDYLCRILKIFCCLQETEKNDLAHNSDKIIAALNLIRYLAINDIPNATNFWNYIGKLRLIFLKPLNKALDLSKTRCELDKKCETEFISVNNNQGDIIHSCRIWIKQSKNYSTNNNNNDNDKYEDDIRNKILAASISFVVELGWSRECLIKGAEKCGYPGISHGMFNRGAGDLVHYFNTNSNQKLVDHLKEFQRKCTTDHDDDDPITPGKFVEHAIQQRLEMLVPFKHKWPQAIAIMSLPPNVPNSLAALLTMVDDICYYAGDRSVDFNWYIRRLGVAGVYKATELYLIQDKSLDHKNTWIFLKRRMDEAVQLNEIISKSDMASQGAKDVANSVFVTARNILGVNWNK